MPKTNQTSKTGGSVRLTIPSGGTIAGSDIKVRWCYIQAAAGNASSVRVNIDSACAANTGVLVPVSPTLTPVRVFNLNQLNFIGTEDDIIDILYGC